jgi:AMME syndrome candidate gene 1 protein
MTSKAYCFYCFECLSASFENREPRSLEHIVQLYDEYEAEKSKDGTAEDADGVTDDEEDAEDVSAEAVPPNTTHPQVPSISRLQASHRNSSSRSSSTSASTPSVLSANSSQSQLPSHLTSSTSISSTKPTYASRLSLTATYPLFVTWNTVSRSGNKSLRGCIGTFDALPLPTGLSTYALTSAFEDTRFSPIPKTLLPNLSCSLTLLADFEPCANALDWTLGTHGLRISFTYRSRRHGATYLPDVAVEQGWSKEECVESLMRKAGWDGGSRGISRRLLRGPDNTEPWDTVSDFRTVRYTGLRSSAEFEEWEELRKWADGRP